MTDQSDPVLNLIVLVQQQQSDFARFAWRCLALRGREPDLADIEDVMSDAFVVAMSRLREEPLLKIRNLGGWFRKILFFQCLRRARKWRFEGWDALVTSLEEGDYVLDILQHTTTPPDDPDLAILARELLDRLGPLERRIVELSISGYTSSEIAALEGETPANVRQLKSRALKRLREYVMGAH